MKRTKVSLRSWGISKGRKSLYLDYNPAVRVPETMKMTRQEYLGMYIFTKPKNQIEKEYNKNTLAQAEAIRGLRVQSLINEEFGFLDNVRLQSSFLEYFKKLIPGHGPSWESAYKHFAMYVKGSCSFAQLNVDLCVKYRDYILRAPQVKHPDKTISTNTDRSSFFFVKPKKNRKTNNCLVILHRRLQWSVSIWYLINSN